MIFSPVLSEETPFQPNPQKAELQAAEAAPHSVTSWFLMSHSKATLIQKIGKHLMGLIEIQNTSQGGKTSLL